MTTTYYIHGIRASSFFSVIDIFITNFNRASFGVTIASRPRIPRQKRVISFRVLTQENVNPYLCEDMHRFL